ncbi:MAG: hypothetical protein ACKO4U_10780, partial [Caldilinea sp.]
FSKKIAVSGWPLDEKNLMFWGLDNSAKVWFNNCKGFVSDFFSLQVLKKTCKGLEDKMSNKCRAII